LGVTFQNNGLYAAHIQNVVDKCHKHLNMMRFLKGTSWGASKSPLLTIYRSLVWSILEYGMEAYFFSGVPGNEIADSLAKLATFDSQHQDLGEIRLKTVNTSVRFADICQHLRDHFDNVWNAKYESDMKGTSYKAIFPWREKEDLRLI